MTGAAITQLFERLGRLTAATKQKAGNETTWDYTFPDGETHRYVIRGLKSRAEAEDSAFNLLIWVWNAKDYLKRWAESNGKNAQIVEDAVTANAALAVCADLANRLKHGDLKRSRSGRFPRFGVVSFETPQAALGSLTFRAFEVEMEIANPALVEFHLLVADNTGGEMHSNTPEGGLRSLNNCGHPSRTWSNVAPEQTAGSHALAGAAHRERYAAQMGLRVAKRRIGRDIAKRIHKHVA